VGTTAPEIAVVIPTRGREARLAFALESLAGQLEPDRFEVVVVRDADAREPFAIPPPELPVRHLTLPAVAGPTPKRNLGWRATEAPLVAFTDDDCRAAPGWLTALLASAAGSAVFLQGRTAPDPDERHLLHGLARSVEVDGPGGWFETCNMAYPRALLERLGGFDETFGFGGEDTDLAWRAIESGAEPRFVGEALVWHAVVSRTAAKALSDATRWRDLPAVVARHPGLHAWLYRRHFWNREHMAIAIALAGLPVARRRPALAAMAAVPYLSARVNWREPHPRRIARALATMPLFAALDTIEVAARLPAAIRHGVAVV
jgi:GT2 family glycosyltransferase